MRPVICLITDRRRLDPPGEDALVARVAAAAAARVHLVQVRERDLEGRALVRLVRRCVAAASGRTRIIVNERVDVALAAGAHGVHLRGDSMPAPRVRQIAPRGFIIGRSIHGLAEAAAAADVDYLLFGTVFKTLSKPGRAAAGLDALRHAAAAAAVPVLAVGGVTAAGAAELANAGAAGFAAIGMFAGGPHDGLAAIVEQASRAFDTAVRQSLT